METKKSSKKIIFVFGFVFLLLAAFGAWWLLRSAFKTTQPLTIDKGLVFKA